MQRFNDLTTRLFLCAATLLATASARAEDQPVTIRVEPDTVISRISPDFIGFGYETSAVAQSNFFSGTNTVMARLYNNLSPHGLIRIGGNVSDHTRFVPDGVAAPKTERETTIINSASFKNLGDFARLTGWKVMWGLNLGSGTKEEAVQEAVAVDSALGTNLHSFEIGNEVDALRRFSRNYAAYHDAYVEYKAAIRAALPSAKFSGPDVIGNWEWITNFAATESRDMELLTQHYYRGGQANPSSTLERLLQHDTNFDARLDKLRQLCDERHLGFRINEVNSYSGGGKPGVSDTFGSALWCLDYLFTLASHGCEGVNMETDVNQLGFLSYYSPIVHEPDGRCSVRPEYYGMQAFAMAGNGQIVRLTLEKTEINLSAYATKEDGGQIWITVINRDLSRDASIDVHLPPAFETAELFLLNAPSVESKDHVVLTGWESSGTRNLGQISPRIRPLTNGIATFSLSKASAAIIRVPPRKP